MSMTKTPQNSAMEMTRVSARWRIVGWIVLTTLLALLAVTVTMRSFLMGQVSESANAAIAQEFDEFRVFAQEGVDPTTAEPFTSLEPSMQRYLSRQTPATGEAIIAVVGDQVMYTDNARDDPGELLASDRARLNELVQSSENSGVTDGEHGEMRWGKMSAGAPGSDEQGTLIVVHFTQEAREAVNRQVVVLVGIAMAGLLLTAGIGWLAAGRILQPIRTMREVADSVTAQDLSTRIPVHGRDDLSQLAHTLNNMLDRVERAYGSQQHFVLEAQHHLRGPLSRTAQAIETLATADENPAERRRAAQQANRQIRSMRRTLVDLDLLAQSDKPDFVQPHRVSLKQLTVEIYADAAENNPGRQWNLESTANGEAWVDPARIADAMHQVVRNAVDHTEPQDSIRVGSTLTDQGKTLRMWVTNHGIPLNQEQAEALFEMYRTEAQGEDESGMGLGLAVVRAVADAHNGSAWVESGGPSGTRFGMDIPVAAPAPRTDGEVEQLAGEVHESMREER